MPILMLIVSYPVKIDRIKPGDLKIENTCTLIIITKTKNNYCRLIASTNLCLSNLSLSAQSVSSFKYLSWLSLSSTSPYTLVQHSHHGHHELRKQPVSLSSARSPCSNSAPGTFPIHRQRCHCRGDDNQVLLLEWLRMK